MKNRYALASLVWLAFAVAGPLAAAEHRHGGHEHQNATRLQLDHGRKWPTDEVLRRNMDALRASFAERLGAIRAGTLRPGEYKLLGAKVEAGVADIVAQCKLAPEADAMLHFVVADLVAAADLLQGKARGTPRSGAHRAIAALNGYGRYFDHPNWQAIE